MGVGVGFLEETEGLWQLCQENGLAKGLTVPLTLDLWMGLGLTEKSDPLNNLKELIDKVEESCRVAALIKERKGPEPVWWPRFESAKMSEKPNVVGQKSGFDEYPPEI